MKKHVIDYWSIPHFLFGAVTALASVVFSVPGRYGLLATFLFAIGWEFFEKKVKIGEHVRNAIADVVLPILSFPMTFLYATHFVDDRPRNAALLIVVVLLYLYSNFASWRARFENDTDYVA